MKKAAIVIDSWKLPIFKKTLDYQGYEYGEIKGPGSNCITLQVKVEDLNIFAPLVKEINQKATNSRLH